jgi:hypothetical protein
MLGGRLAQNNSGIVNQNVDFRMVIFYLPDKRIKFFTASAVATSLSETVKEDEMPMMSAPASARASAMALPMPLLHPVTSAVFPERSNKLVVIN